MVRVDPPPYATAMNDQGACSNIASNVAARMTILFLLVGLAILFVITPFLSALGWSAVVTIALWPIFVRLRRFVRSETVAALGMSVLILGLFLGAIVPAAVRLIDEIEANVGSGSQASPAELAAQVIERVHDLPVFGTFISEWLEAQGVEHGNLRALIERHQKQLFSWASKVARGVINALVTFSAVIVFGFFFFRDGERMAATSRRIAQRLFGARGIRLADVTVSTIRGTVLGVVVTALAQSLLALIGFWVSGAPVPVFLAFLTLLLALLPFGAPLVYTPVSIALIANGSPWYVGVGLFLWGVCVVSTIDNVLRPIFISQATQISLFYIILAVLGGLMTMGLLGVFIGPLVMSWAADLLDGEQQTAGAAPHAV